MKIKTRGQALTEFALILPLLLLLLLGIIEGARIIWAYITVQNAAREAARYAVSGQPLINGEPWMLPNEWTAGPFNDRVDYIKAKAVELASGLPVAPDALATTGLYSDTYKAKETVPGALGVTVWGQRDPTSGKFVPDHASEQGLNVWVEVYYNVMMLDPIYAAIVPGGYVHLVGRVQMQNEGIDTVLGGQPPLGFNVTLEPPGEGNSGLPGGGDAIVYVNGQEDGVSVEAGSSIQVTFYSPNHCGASHDVYFDQVKIGTMSATSGTCLSDGVVTYYISPATEPGTHTVHFTLQGDTVVFDSQEIQVMRSSLARIETGGIRWPVGTTINIELYAHPGGSDIDLFIKPKGAPDSDWEYIGTIHTKADGEATGSDGLAYPITKSPGDYQLSSRPGTPGHDADVTTELARTEIAVLEACLTINQSIVCGQAQTVPASARINIVLRNHAPGRTYSLYFVDRSLGTEDPIGNVTTDQFGEGVIQYYISFDQPDGSYLVESRDGSTVVATAEVIVSTPETPYIIIAGGRDTWPAGSPITIQMQKHCDPPYDLYIGTGTPGSWAVVDTVGTNLDTDTPPTCQRWVNYIIPPTFLGDYLIVSRKDNTDIAYADLTVELSPALTIDGGEFHVPGSPITIRLSGHVPSQNYSVYVVNLDTSEETLVAENFLPDASGERKLTWNIPPSASGSYRVESRVYGTSEVVAHAPLTIQAADLELVSLRVPSNLPLAQEFPVTVTVRNNAAFDIGGRSFDVDIYLDPSIPPNNPDSSLPPGDRKLWISGLGAGKTTTVVGKIAIYGGNVHDLWARVDTSRRIAETDELNNFAHSTVSVPAGCSILLTDSFDTRDTAWKDYVWGDGGKGVPPDPFAEVSGGKLILNGSGSNTWVNNDVSFGGSVTLLRALEGNYDLDVWVHVEAASTGSKGKAGIEIRDSLDGGAVKLDYVRDNDKKRLQAGYRDFLYDGMESSNDASNIKTPVWLRVKRLGNRFEFWYSLQDNPTQSDSDWKFQTSRDLPMGDNVFVGFIHASYVSSNPTSSQFDNFRLCAREATAPVEPPPGLKECSQLLENGDFETLDDWNPPGWVYPSLDPPVNTGDATNPYQGQYSVYMPAYSYSANPKPAWLYQEISMPTWVSGDATAQLEGFKLVDQRGEPDPDPLYFVLRGTDGVTQTSPVMIAAGDDTSDTWDPFTSDDVMGSVANPADYADQKLQAYIYSPNQGAFDTIFRLDNLELNVCVQQPLPPPLPAPGTGAIRGSVQYLTTGGLIRPAPGAWVWIYAIDGSLFKTFAIQDATYSFNDIPPGTYTMYAEYSDGTNLYFVIPPPIAVGANSVVTQNLLLAR